MYNKKIIRDLGAGLILRHGAPQDGEALALFNGEQLGDDGLAGIDGQGLVAMTRDIFSGRPHVSLKPDDFTIVEETASGRIVSAMCLISQTWTYDGIEFGMGRPEYVATHPDFRKRGLIRAQFEVVHQWSATRGEMVQGITGIPYFYRQFGYEFALNLSGRRYGSIVPRMKGAAEDFTLRPAEEKDIPFLMATYEDARKRSMISANWSQVHWHNNLYELSPDNLQKLAFLVIETTETQELVGYLAHPTHLVMSGIYAFHFELSPGVSWLEVAPVVVRYLWERGFAYAQVEQRRCEHFGFYLGGEHPVYEALGNLLPVVRPPYGWYLRVPDLVGFLNHIQPALERRLAESIACGHSGEYLIGMYPHGVKLVLESGRIAALEPWQPKHADHGNAGFPALTFLQVLFGYRSFDELQHAFPDCWSDGDETRIIINALFPKKNSNVYGIV